MMTGKLPTMTTVLAAAALILAAPLPVSAGGGKGAKELEQLERQLQRQGKITRRLPLEPGGPRPAASQNPCGDALGACWRTVGCRWGFCLCVAERSCLERQERN